MDFLRDVLMWACVITVVVVPLWLAWRYWLSIKVVPPNFVALALFLGEPQREPDPNHIGQTIPHVYQSGRAFVPYCFGIKWDGHDPWELTRVPIKMFRLKYEGSEEHQIWSSDHQLLRVEISAYVRFPFNDPEAIALLVKSDVPLTEDGLTDWAEEEIVAVVRDVIAGIDYKTAISRNQLVAINTSANTLFNQRDGLLCRTGVCGQSAADKTPGTGEVLLKIEQVLLTEKLQGQLESIQTASLGIQIAESEAKQEAARVAAVDVAMDKWVKTQADALKKSVEDVLPVLKADGSWEKQRSGYMAQILGGELIRVGNADGTPMSGQLGPATAFAGALAGLFGGRGRSQGQQGGGQQGSQKGKKMTQDEARKFFEDQFGYKPDW